MDASLMLWLLSGAVVLLAMMLFVVAMARRMDKGQPVIKTQLPDSVAKALGLKE